MKQSRQLLFIIVCGCLVLHPFAVIETRAQTLPGEPAPPPASDSQYLSSEQELNTAIDWAKFGKQPDGNQAVDATIAIMTVGYPPAGVALGFIKSLITSGGPDPAGEALKALNDRINELHQRLDNLQREVDALRDDHLRQANLDRLRWLLDHRDDLENLSYRLQKKPTDNNEKDNIVHEAQVLAARFLSANSPDQDLWRWSDMRVATAVVTDNDGKKHNVLTSQMVPPDFKPLPTFEYYVSALVLWMNAIEYAYGDDTEFVKRTYGRELLKHAAFLSVRPPWRELESKDVPETLPEQIMRRVNCYVEPVSKYPTNGVCNARQVCEDVMRRTRTDVGTAQFSMPSDNMMCSLRVRTPRAVSAQEQERRWADAGQNPHYGSQAMALWQTWRVPIVASKEEELEQSYGVEAMTLLADKLERLAKFGTTREQFIGTFGTTPINYHPAFVYAIANNGDLLWYRQETNASKWTGPKGVGNGWQNFKDVIPAGGNSFYALTQDGLLKWYRHDGFNDGSFAWKGPVDVGSGWNFAKIFSGSDGIVYAIKDDGTLLWYRHGGFADGGGVNTWSGPKVVGSGWLQFKHVFSGGQGIIYAVKPDGQMLWYRHDGYATGDAKWTGPLTVGSGWQNFRAIIPTGDGIILAITEDGKFLWYKHTDYLTGTSVTGVMRASGPGVKGRVVAGATVSGIAHWEGPVQIGTGWQGFRQVIALNPSAPGGPR
jgi:hypothetical protein